MDVTDARRFVHGTRNAKQHHTPEFDLPEELRRMSAGEWLNLSEENFKRLFRRSPDRKKKV